MLPRSGSMFRPLDLYYGRFTKNELTKLTITSTTKNKKN
jgi:hypothetical protein